MNNTLCKTEQYFVHNTVTLWYKSKNLKCKTLCNVVQYVNKNAVQSFYYYIDVQKVVQLEYFVKKSAILGHNWQYWKFKN